jgi:hypothetical protein
VIDREIKTQNPRRIDMATMKREKNSVIEKNDKSAALKTRLRTLTVRSGVTAGLARAGCSPCHRPSNHNETLVTR